MSTYKTYEDYVLHARKIEDLNNTCNVMHWDMEVMMPVKGALRRGQQLATLSGIQHDLATDIRYGELMADLLAKGGLTPKQHKNISLSYLDFQKEQKLPKQHVEQLSLVTARANNVWQEAKTQKDFTLFLPVLTDIVELQIKSSEYLGYESHPYDALLDNYEPGLTVSTVEKVFEDVKAELVPFIKELLPNIPALHPLATANYDIASQFEFSTELLQQMHYDFEAGRLDQSAHPFSTSFSANDVRITTRLDEQKLLDGIGSTVHEGGHALHSLGVSDEDYGLPSGTYISLALAESQSRIYENNIGRSLSYWKYNYPKLQAKFPKQLTNVSLGEFYQAINHVSPSLIRVEADELTYHMHILTRFEIEKALIERSLQPKDIAAAWNEKYEAYLGVKPKDDGEGCLQDIHWAHAAFGYFPTYSLGSFYAAQYEARLLKDRPTVLTEIEAGDLSGVKKWLNEEIHIYGRLENAEEICERVTGEPLNLSYFMTYVKQKYGGLVK